MKNYNLAASGLHSHSAPHKSLLIVMQLKLA